MALSGLMWNLPCVGGKIHLGYRLEPIWFFLKIEPFWGNPGCSQDVASRPTHRRHRAKGASKNSSQPDRPAQPGLVGPLGYRFFSKFVGPVGPTGRGKPFWPGCEFEMPRPRLEPKWLRICWIQTCEYKSIYIFMYVWRQRPF